MPDLVLRTVTGTIKKADGSLWTSAELRFIPFVVVNAEGVTVPIEPVTVTTHPTTAVFSASLFTLEESFVRYFVDLPSGEKYQFDLPDGVGSITLAELLIAAGLEQTDENATALLDLINIHAGVKASSTQLGHVKIDDDTIVIDDGGVISSAVRVSDDFALEFLPEQDLDPGAGALFMSHNASFGHLFSPSAVLGDCWWEFQFISYPQNTQGVISDIGHGGSHPMLLESIGTSTIQRLYGNMFNGSTNIEANGKDWFATNSLHHAVYAVFGQVLYLYLDGVLTAGTSFTGTRTVGSLANDGWLYLGASGEHQQFYGKILRARGFEEVGGNGLPFVTPPGAFTPERVFGDVWNGVAAIWNVDLTRPSKKIQDTSPGYDGKTHSGYRALNVGSQNWPEEHLPQFVPTPYELATYSGTPLPIPVGAAIFDDFSDDNRTLFYNYDQTFAATYPSIAGQGRTARVGGAWLGAVFGMPVIGILEGHAVALAANINSAQSAWMPTPNATSDYVIDIYTGSTGGGNVIVRREDDGNYILVMLEPTQLTYYRWVGGVGAFIVGGPISDPNFVSATVECRANQITVTVGTQQFELEENTLLDGINVGFAVTPLQRLKYISVVEILPDTTPPNAPVQNQPAVVSDSRIDLSWNAATDNGGGVVSGYEYRVDGGAAVDAGNVLTIPVTGLNSATEYDFEIRAYDNSGNRSAWSNLESATTLTGPISIVAHLGQGSPDGNSFTTSAIDTSGGSLLVVAVSINASDNTFVLSDSKGNTWVGLTKYAQVFPSIRLFYVKNPIVGTGHTFTLTCTAASGPALAIVAFDTTDTSANADGNTGSSGVLSTVQPGSLTPSQNDSVLVTAVSEYIAVSGINSGFTILDIVPAAGGSFGVALAYKIQTAAGPENPTWTFGTADQSAVAMTSFKHS